MYFYDLIHGYQPFDPSVFVPKWIKRNLKDKFLPTSSAMKKGLIPRGVQLQGWTIEAWLAAKKSIHDLAQKTLKNLKIANQKGNIEIGASAYSHPILPMLSDDLIKIQIILDREAVEKRLGKATWFWPPEGAIDQRTLKIIHQIFPDLILLIPDKAVGRYNFNGPVKIKFSASLVPLDASRSGMAGRKNSFQKAIVFNTLFKDLFMNAEDYRRRPKYVKRPKHLPKELVWAQVRRTVHSPKVFLQVLNFLKDYYRSPTSIVDGFILMRDWENAGSKKGLRRKENCKDIGVFSRLKDKIDFRLPGQFDWEKAEIVSINKIIPASWDMESTPQDPFPWWRPNKEGKIWKQRKPFRRKRIIEWQELIREFDQVFQKKVKEKGGLEKSLADKGFKDSLKQTLPALHSCIGWHYFAKRSWKPDYQYSQAALENIVLPNLEKLKKL